MAAEAPSKFVARIVAALAMIGLHAFLLSGCIPEVVDDRLPAPSFVTLTNGQAAGFVVGQPSFSGAGAPSASVLSGPAGNVIFVGNTLYVTDFGYSRVLGFNTAPTASGASADFVLGQASFVANTVAVTQTGLSGPIGQVSAGGAYFLCDGSANRVLGWKTPPISAATPADLVLGQANFTSSAVAVGATGMNNPNGLASDGTRLIVTDNGNSRVLIWNTLPTTSGQPADLVLGQTDFAGGSSNHGIAAAADTLALPSGAWTDGNRLVVADTVNNRVLIWNIFPTVNGQSADVVLGQPDFVTTTAGTSATAFNLPTYPDGTPFQLAVSDTNNNRVLIWNTVPTQSGVPADVVLGQATFTAGGVGGGATGFAVPRGVQFAGTSLMVTDTNDARIMVFVSQ